MNPPQKSHLCAVARLYSGIRRSNLSVAWLLVAVRGFFACGGAEFNYRALGSVSLLPMQAAARTQLQKAARSAGACWEDLSNCLNWTSPTHWLCLCLLACFGFGGLLGDGSPPSP